VVLVPVEVVRQLALEERLLVIDREMHRHLHPVDVCLEGVVLYGLDLEIVLWLSLSSLYFALPT
jgi:hypothetical protein